MYSPLIGFMTGKKASSADMVMFSILNDLPRFYRTDTNPWTLVDPIGSTLVTSGQSCDYNPINKQLCYGGGGTASYQVWDTTTTPFTSIYAPGAINSGRATSFSKDGNLMAVGLGSFTTNYVYDANDYPTRWQTQAGQAAAMVFNYDNTLLAVVMSAGQPTQKLWVYDVTTFPGTLIPTPALAPPTCYSAEFHPTLNILLLGSGTSWYLYDMDTFTVIDTLNVGYQSLGLKWNATGDRLAVCLAPSGERARVYDTSSIMSLSAWFQIPLVDAPTVNNCFGIGWNADGSYLACGRSSETPGLIGWDTTVQPYTTVSDFDTPPVITGTGVTDVCFLNGALPP